jgi:hypothetical protein
MAYSTQTKLDSGRGIRWDFTFAFLVLRFWLGARALFAGVEKFGAYKSVAMPLIDPATGQPDASGVMVNVNIKSYALANYVGIPAALKDKFAHDPLFPKFALAGGAGYSAISAGAGISLYCVDHWFGAYRSAGWRGLSWYSCGPGGRGSSSCRIQ